MTLIPRGRSLVLDRPIDPKTETRSKKQVDPRTYEAKTASAVEDSCITVVENPSIDGYTGLLLARHFTERKTGERQLTDVQYLRVYGDVVRELVPYEMLQIQKGYHEGDFEFVPLFDGGVMRSPTKMPYIHCWITPREHGEFYDKIKPFVDAQKYLNSLHRLFEESLDDVTEVERKDQEARLVRKKDEPRKILDYLAEHVPVDKGEYNMHRGYIDPRTLSVAIPMYRLLESKVPEFFLDGNTLVVPRNYGNLNLM